MKFKVVKYLLIILVFTASIYSGCSSDDSKSKYVTAAKQFNKIYFETVECIDSNNLTRSLEELQTEVNIKNIEKLGLLLVEIKENIPKEKEPHYLDFKKRYEDIRFLYESYPESSNLNTENRRKIYMIFISIGVNKADWKDNNSTTVWE